MTFKLPNLPSPQAKAHELADFAELTAWEYGTVSEREVIGFLGRVGENDKNRGVDDTENEQTDALPEVMIEIERRALSCRKGYPFSLKLEGTVLKYEEETDHKTESSVYKYLLLSTRLNMQSNKMHAGLDGTKLLEELSAHVLKNYLGDRSRSSVFGTAAHGSFRTKVDKLCEELHEGIGFRVPKGDSGVNAVDDKLDAVAWIPFSDRLPGQLILFGQCKTGTNWAGLETQLRPEVFAKKWLKEGFLVDPVRAFCLSEALDQTKWKRIQFEAGILFDRCRLVDFCTEFPHKDIATWTEAAFDSFDMGDLALPSG